MIAITKQEMKNIIQEAVTCAIGDYFSKNYQLAKPNEKNFPQASEIRAKLRHKLGDKDMDAWFNNVKFLCATNAELLICTVHTFAKEWLQKRYHLIIQETVNEVVGRHTRIAYAASN
jgi:hypothetical protein